MTNVVQITVSADLVGGVTSVPMYVDVDNKGIAMYGVTANEANGETQIISFTGDWPNTSAHEVACKLNAYVGTSPSGTNLHIKAISIDNVTVSTGHTLYKVDWYKCEFPVAVVTPPVTPPTPPATGIKLAPVYIGGISSDMHNLGVAANTTQLRLAGAAAYFHESWILGNADIGPAQTGGCYSPTSKATVSTTLTSILTAFSAQPAPMIELGMPAPFGTGDVVGVKQLIACNFQSAGILPDVALVNMQIQGTAKGAFKVAHPTTLAEWTAYVDLLKSMGIKGVFVINAPNGGASFDNIDWNSSEYDLIRQMALYGGGLAVDTPPSEFLAWGSKLAGNGYVTWNIAAKAWCKANNIPFVMILSPYSGGSENTTFQADCEAWIASVTADGIPVSSFVIETYTTDPGSPTRGNTLPTIDTETTSPSLAYTALWIAKNKFSKVSIS